MGIAVKSIEEALRFYCDKLGLGKGVVRLGPRYKTAFVTVGDSKIELLEDLKEDGIIAQHIQRRGEEIHHIALTVDNLELTLEALKTKGIFPIGGEAEPSLVAWLHPRDSHGVLIELCDKKYKEERERPSVEA